MQTGAYGKAHECCPSVTTGIWARNFTVMEVYYTLFERQLLICYWTLIETAPMTEEHKIILKTLPKYILGNA